MPKANKFRGELEPDSSFDQIDVMVKGILVDRFYYDDVVQMITDHIEESNINDICNIATAKEAIRIHEETFECSKDAPCEQDGCPFEE